MNEPNKPEEEPKQDIILEIDDGYIGFDEILRRSERRSQENQTSEETSKWPNQ